MRPEIQEPHEHSKLEELTDNLKSYINTLYELNRLKAIDKLSSMTADVTVYIILLLLFMLILSFISIGTAIWINICLGSSFSGFFIVAGVYVLMAIIVVAMKSKIIKVPVSNAIIKNVLTD
ncbi:MAG: hypothetical protein H7296_12495 [Bacteroidia bacterium]|nr:hypothetical protein [Bacteroidia bacterium]